MQTKWICAAITLAMLSGCVTQPAYVPKTDAQIAQEVLDDTVAKMKQRGASQEEIDKTVAYMNLPYEDQLKQSIKPSDSSTPTENLVGLIDRSLFYCDLQRNSLKIKINADYTLKTQKKLSECIVTTSSIISSFYYKSYMNDTAAEAVRSSSDETYLKWKGYTNSILQSSPPYLQEQASLELKNQVNRFQQVFLRDVISKKKK